MTYILAGLYAWWKYYYKIKFRPVAIPFNFMRDKFSLSNKIFGEKFELKCNFFFVRHFITIFKDFYIHGIELNRKQNYILSGEWKNGTFLIYFYLKIEYIYCNTIQIHSKHLLNLRVFSVLNILFLFTLTWSSCTLVFDKKYIEYIHF